MGGLERAQMDGGPRLYETSARLLGEPVWFDATRRRFRGRLPKSCMANHADPWLEELLIGCLTLWHCD
jgi:hypothetical protein